MSRLGISYQDVAEAADKLLLQHESPTMENVRQYLGGTGSFTTLSKYLNTWRSKRLMATVKVDPNRIIPPDQVSLAVQGVWEQLTSQANQQIETLKQETQAQITSLFTEKQQFEEEKSNLQKLLEAANLKINHLSTDKTLLQKELTELLRQHELLQQDCRRLEQQLQQAQQAKIAHVTDIQHIYEEAREAWQKQAEQQQKITTENLQNLQVLLENQRTDFMVKLDEFKVTKDKADRALIKAENELIQLSVLMKERVGQLTAKEQENKVLSQALKVYEQTDAAKEKELAVLHKELQMKDVMLQTHKQQVTTLTQHIDSLNTLIKAGRPSKKGDRLIRVNT
ncbi:hypothetical protein BH10PSE19_BH10PSE19_01700 [soil metagenome]